MLTSEPNRIEGQVPTLSIVIPVRDRLQLLAELVDDIEKESINGLDVLIVLDPAQHASMDEVRTLVSEKSGFRIFQSRATGAGPGRNTGLELACGEWIWFIDSDDRLPQGAIHAVMGAINQSDSDVLLFGASIINGVTLESAPWISRYRDIVKSRNVVNPREFADNIFQFTTPSPWNLVLRKSFVLQQSLRFSQLPSSNDLSFVMTALASARFIGLCRENIYHYRRNSFGSSQVSENSISLLQATLELRRNLLNRGLLCTFRFSYRRFIWNTVIRWWLPKKPVRRSMVLALRFPILLTDLFGGPESILHHRAQVIK